MFCSCKNCMMMSRTIREFSRWQTDRQTHPQTDTTENIPRSLYAVAARMATIGTPTSVNYKLLCFAQLPEDPAGGHRHTEAIGLGTSVIMCIIFVIETSVVRLWMPCTKPPLQPREFHGGGFRTGWNKWDTHTLDGDRTNTQTDGQHHRVKSPLATVNKERIITTSFLKG